MKIYRNSKTEKIFTKKELAKLLKDMQDNGVEFLETPTINNKVDVQYFRYKNGNEIVELEIDRIIE